MTDTRLTEQELPFPEQSQLEDMVQHVITQAQKAGADAVAAGVSIDAGLSVTVRLGETETLEFNRDRSLGLTVYFNHRKGSASTADFHRKACQQPSRQPVTLRVIPAVMIAPGCRMLNAWRP